MGPCKSQQGFGISLSISGKPLRDAEQENGSLDILKGSLWLLLEESGSKNGGKEKVT